MKISEVRVLVRNLILEAVVPKNEILQYLLDYIDWSENAPMFRNEVETALGRPIVSPQDLLEVFQFQKKNVNGATTLTTEFGGTEYAFSFKGDSYASDTHWYPLTSDDTI